MFIKKQTGIDTSGHRDWEPLRTFPGTALNALQSIKESLSPRDTGESSRSQRGAIGWGGWGSPDNLYQRGGTWCSAAWEVMWTRNHKTATPYLSGSGEGDYIRDQSHISGLATNLLPTPGKVPSSSRTSILYMRRGHSGPFRSSPGVIP